MIRQTIKTFYNLSIEIYYIIKWNVISWIKVKEMSKRNTETYIWSAVCGMFLVTREDEKYGA